ncbi:MAG: hypothetical protein NT166_21100 [Candidatus Aminicenantes bacterium]|nr:hypothetical protein [Candidatus Aminicenantes bacterium]
MDIATVEKAVDFFVSNLDPSVIGDLGFDGGEPFLNWDLIEHAAMYAQKKAAQWKKKLFFHISANGTMEPWIMSREDLDIIKNEFTKLAGFYTDQLLNGRFFILRNFYIFPCYKFSGIPQYRLGNVHGEPIDKEMQRQFVDNQVERRPGCRDCWAGIYAAADARIFRCAKRMPSM